MKQKYLIVDAKEMKKKVFDFYREPAYNELNNYYEIKEMKGVKVYFDKKEIPEEFQKIILRVYSPKILSSTDAEELFLNQKFNLSKAQQNTKSDKMINGSAVAKFYDNSMIPRNIIFKTKKDYKTVDDVLKFIHDLENSGYIEEYIDVLKELSEIEVSKEKNISYKAEKSRVRKRNN